MPIERRIVVPAITYAAAQHQAPGPFAPGARVVVVRLTLSDASGTLTAAGKKLFGRQTQVGNRRRYDGLDDDYRRTYEC
jgi:hypothetical protein